ncbi:MAG: GIDE domain-containing protein [Sandaracinaceae bacterium]
MEVIGLTVLFFVLAAGGFAAWWFSADQRGKRRLKEALKTRIADAPQDALVKITGTLARVDERELEAPITGRRCVGYVIDVKEHRVAGANPHWETIILKEDAIPFLLEDETGTALVHANGAHLVLVRDGHVRSGALDEHSERAKAFLMAQGTESENVIRKKKAFRYEEGVLEPGEEVSVLGVAHWEHDAEGTKRLVLDPARGQTLTISDDPSTL